MIRKQTLLIFVMMLAAFAGRVLAGTSIKNETIRTRDGSRNYLVAWREGSTKAARPLVIVLHGHMGSAKNVLGKGLQERSPLSEWASIADREDIVVAALDGARGADGKQGWNDGRPGDSRNPTTDDVGFVRAVIERIEREQKTDPDRVYAMGMSNGGVFSFRLAMELDHALAAIVAAGASMPGDHPPAKSPRAISVLMIEGTDDPLMPYDGGQVHFYNNMRGYVLGAETSLNFWKAMDGLKGDPVVESIPHTGRNLDTTRVVRMTWGDSKGPQIMLLKVQGGGHCEPSINHRYGFLYTSICGRQNTDIESVEAAWKFFKTKQAK
jgi:polyhydroxybutyrate depolymerase